MPALLSARGVRRSFGAVTALDGIDLELAPGELLGLVGPDGAGKSTLLRCLVGVVDPDPGGGEVAVDGVPWKRAPAEAREHLGYMPQQQSLYGDLSVEENLRFFADLFDVPRAAFAERRARLLAITRLDAARERPAAALSGGLYKKLAIACALLHDPRALVLDEPTNGVDPVSRRELWELLHEFVAAGVGVLVATAYMDEVARCGRVAMLHRGRILREGTPAGLLGSFEDRVIRVEAPDPEIRRAADAILDGDPRVIAATPAGTRLKAVIGAGDVDAVAARLAEVGARTAPGAPDFEDVYLSAARRARA
jgi:ABC-2 type transport system ATP-binding protein